MARKIAIVEDELAIAENYRDALVRHGYEVALYAERLPALQAFRQRLPDLAIIDVGLGEDIEGGFELCRELRLRSCLSFFSPPATVSLMWSRVCVWAPMTI